MFSYAFVYFSRSMNTTKQRVLFQLSAPVGELAGILANNKVKVYELEQNMISFN